MKLGVDLRREHTEFVTCVCWAPDGTLVSVSDDKDVIRWSADGEKIGKITSLSAFPTAVAWFPTSGKQVQDLFAVSCTDGSVRYISKSGREEKKISAHEGAVIVLKWSHDGSALCTAGEDGDVKIWSKNGNLRSTLVSLGQSIYTLSWAPDDDHLVIGNGKVLLIKSIQNNKKNLQWNAHEGVILTCDWNISNNLIVSGGEDCTYKVWDSYGRLLYTAKPMEHFVTSVAWSPNGDYFAVGSYNLLKLCDKVGWTYARERMNSGSLYNIAFTFDNTQLAGACGNNSTIFANIIDRRYEYKNVEVTMLNSKRIRIFDNSNDNTEEIDIAKDRIVDIRVGYEFIIITTLSQCYIYNIGNVNTPIIFDIKSSSQFIHLANNKYFLLCDHMNGINIYNYDGKFVSSPKFPNFRPELYTKELVALSNDVIAIVDCIDSKSFYLFDVSTGKTFGKYTHANEITKIYANQSNQGERLLVFVDKSNDLYVCLVNVSALPVNNTNMNNSVNGHLATYKLQAHVESVIFHDTYNVLVCISDSSFIVYYHPEVIFTNRDLLAHCKVVTESQNNDYGRNAQIVAFSGNRVNIRKIDGSVVYSSTSVDVPLLDDLIYAGRWDEATRLCRHQKSPVLWSALAALAINRKQLEPAETALSEIGEVAKVEYIQSIKAIPCEEGRNAELLVFKKQYDEAERMLLQASPPLIYRLIKMNINLFRFQRALEFANRYKSFVEVVCFYRQKYLTAFGREENDPKFLSAYQQVRIEEDDVMRREQQELEEEQQRYGSRNYRK